jgi:hypothetical protein
MPFDHFTAPEQRVLSFRVTDFCLTMKVAAQSWSTRTNDLRGVTPHARSTREVSAQAELRPTAPGQLIQAKRCALMALRAGCKALNTYGTLSF